MSILARVTRRIRREVQIASLSFPDRVSCNICGWSGRKFIGDLWHHGTICPKCGSDVRRRLLAAMLDFQPGLTSKEIVAGKRVLHFAPEQSITNLTKPRASSYTTADFLSDSVDLKLDITDMPIIADNSVDLLIACDVLEHVRDFRIALREIKRVIASDGLALLTVPQKQDLKHTFEDPSITCAEDRERAFGQADHLRIFGDDFVDELSSAGFKVRTICAADFEENLVARYVLIPPTPSSHPLATNIRTVFCARVRTY